MGRPWQAKFTRGRLGSIDDLKTIFRTPAPDKVRIGLALASGEVYLYERNRKPGDLDVKVLHEELLGAALGISDEATDKSTLSTCEGWTRRTPRFATAAHKSRSYWNQ